MDDRMRLRVATGVAVGCAVALIVLGALQLTSGTSYGVLDLVLAVPMLLALAWSTRLRARLGGAARRSTEHGRAPRS